MEASDPKHSHIVHIEGGEGVLAGRMAVPMSQRTELLQALCHSRGKAVLPRHVCMQEHILGRLALVAAVRAPQLLHLRSQRQGLSLMCHPLDIRRPTCTIPSLAASPSWP